MTVRSKHAATAAALGLPLVSAVTLTPVVYRGDGIGPLAWWLMPVLACVVAALIVGLAVRGSGLGWRKWVYPLVAALGAGALPVGLALLYALHVALNDAS